jgi:predicted enzyme related to lactoylglutathione lyase
MGRWYWNELFVSNFSVVEKFYGELFRWKFQEEGGDEKRRLILNERREVVGSVQEASSAEKGEKEYWAVYFGVKSLAECAEVVKKSGGEVGMGFDNSSGRHQVMYDSQGAAFWVTETSEEGKEDALQKERVKWRSVLGLVLVFSAVFFGMDRLWALLFTLWVIPDLKNGETHFLERVTKAKNPILYWMIMATWIGLILLTLFYPRG